MGRLIPLLLAVTLGVAAAGESANLLDVLKGEGSRVPALTFAHALLCWPGRCGWRGSRSRRG